MQERKIVYAGLDIETLFLLCDKSDFSVFGVGKIEIFQTRTFNPANFVFKTVYFLRNQDTFRFLELFFLFVWCVFSPISSAIFRKYDRYLKLISKRKIKVLDFDDPQIIDYLKSQQIDLIVVNAWGILAEEIVLAPKFGTVNIHPSKLPQYRGALPTLWALKNKDSETAVTYMLLDKSVDTGKIISQHVFGLGNGDNWISVENKVADIIKKTLISDLKKYLAGELVPFSQDENIKSGTGRYMEYLKIDWENEKAEDIYNKINLYPFLEPELYCYFYLWNRRVEIKKAGLGENVVNMKVGQYKTKGLDVLFQAKDGIIKGRLFLDFSFGNSMKFFLKYF